MGTYSNYSVHNMQFYLRAINMVQAISQRESHVTQYDVVKCTQWSDRMYKGRLHTVSSYQL